MRVLPLGDDAVLLVLVFLCLYSVWILSASFPFFIVLSSLLDCSTPGDSIALHTYTPMNQELESDRGNSHQTLKYTKAKMREILPRIEASQEDHGQPMDTQVSIL